MVEHDTYLALLRRCACRTASDHTRSALTASVSPFRSYSCHTPSFHTLHTSGLYSCVPNDKECCPTQNRCAVSCLSKNGTMCAVDRKLPNSGMFAEHSELVRHPASAVYWSPHSCSAYSALCPSALVQHRLPALSMCTAHEP